MVLWHKLLLLSQHQISKALLAVQCINAKAWSLQRSLSWALGVGICSTQLEQNSQGLGDLSRKERQANHSCLLISCSTLDLDWE